MIVLPTTCRLCPRACGANRALGERGVCGASDELVVARAALHAWEEPPISGSVGSGTVFFAYCPLRCVYCQNAPIAQGHAGRVITVERLSEICLELEAQGAANINFVTPTHFAPHAREAVRLARARGLSLPIVWNTSGYETVEAVRENAGTVDVYLSDFKYMSADAARRYSHAPDYAQVAFAALDAMVKEVGAPAFDEYRGEVRMTCGVIVRHLILPGGLEDSKAVVRAIHERYGDSVMLSLMNQYTPVLTGQELLHYPELAGRVSDATYEELLDFADSLGIKDYFWQEGGADTESFIPPFDLTGV